MVIPACSKASLGRGSMDGECWWGKEQCNARERAPFSCSRCTSSALSDQNPAKAASTQLLPTSYPFAIEYLVNQQQSSSVYDFESTSIWHHTVEGAITIVFYCKDTYKLRRGLRFSDDNIFHLTRIAIYTHLSTPPPFPGLYQH